MTTRTSNRQRSTMKVFRDADINNIETAYNAYEQTESEDVTKTKQTRITGTGWDGEMYFLYAETTYPEIAADPTGGLPEA